MKMPSPLKAVYSYYFPEIRDIISKIGNNYPHEIFLKSINPWLDDFHEITIQNYLNHFKDQIKGINNFENKYFTNWSSEGIFHLLSYIKTFDSEAKIYVFEWDYEWYRWYGENLNLNFTTINQDQNLSELKLWYFFISNPSAINWQIVTNTQINKIANLWHKIILDLTYLWMTNKHLFDLTNKNIFAVIFSMSKPFWLYYYRIWFLFSKLPIKTLIPNKWFKNIHSLIIANQVLDRIKPYELFDKYKSFQEKAIEIFEKKYKFKANKSDVFLLAHCDQVNIPTNLQDELAIYKRGNCYRFCLTPYFHLIESFIK